MTNSYAKSRDTETGTIIEEFIDSYATDDFAIGGYEDLIEKLEVVAGKVDDSAKKC